MRLYYTVVVIVSLLTCWLVWPTVSAFTSKEIQPIASSVSTLSGILFGFVMASISLFASAKDNKLVKNTTLTGHMPKLVNSLHLTMGMLLGVCVTFLIVLFLPDTVTFAMGVNSTQYKYSTVLVTFGIFLLINSFNLFFLAWRNFKSFAEHM